MKSTEFKAGVLFKMDNQYFRVVKCQMVQQPRLAAFMRATIKNIETGAVQERNFKPSEAYDEAEVTKRYMKFSYEDSGLYYFTEEETYESEVVSGDMAKEAMLYDNEADPVVFTFEYLDGKLANILPPTFVIQRVVETDPAVVGDTARSAMKNAKLESGLNIKVQMFIKNGDKVRIDTRTGEYVERV